MRGSPRGRGASTGHCRKRVLESAGRAPRVRSPLREHLRLPGTNIEQPLCPREVFIADLVEISALGIEITDEAVQVLVRAALPGRVRGRRSRTRNRS